MPEHERLEEVIDSVEQIAHKLGLSPHETEKLKQVTQIHPMRISPYYLSLIDYNFLSSLILLHLSPGQN